MTLRLLQDGGELTVIRRRGWGWGLLFSIAGVGFLLLGFLFVINGEHFPHMSPLATAAWSFVLGVICSLLGVGLTRHGEWFHFTGQGVTISSFKWRFVRWSIYYKSAWIKHILISPEDSTLPLYQVSIIVKKRAPVVIGSNLRMDKAWELATAMSEPARLPILESSY